MAGSVILRVTNGPLSGKSFSFEGRSSVVIGRGLDCAIKLPDDEAHRSVSRYHLLLDINPPYVRGRDLGSLNGTFVGGQLIGRRPPGQSSKEAAEQMQPEHDIRSGDAIQMGDTVFTVEVQGETGQEQTRILAPDQTASGRRCSGCGKPLPPADGFSGPGDAFCSSCRSNPVVALKALIRAAGKGAKNLTPLSGLTLLKILGKGAMGAVFLAQSQETGKKIAVKIMLPELAADKRAKAYFLREVENTQAISHNNVVRLFDSGEHEGVFYYTMEYCNAGSAQSLRLKNGGKLPYKTATSIILQSLDGLEHIHNAEIPNVKLADGQFGKGRGLVHRDLKPANIFLHIEDNKRLAKIADVGVGKAFDTAGLSGHTMTGSVGGSPVVMPRQQVINFKYAKPDVDVWAMAAAYYILLTGKFPRDFESGKDPWRVILEAKPIPIRDREPGIPAPLAEVIDRALIDQPEIIFKSAAELKRELQAAWRKQPAG